MATAPSDERRLQALEQEGALREQRLRRVETEIASLMPMRELVGRLEEVIKGLGTDIGELKKELENRTQQERALRVALIGLSGTILITLIGAIVTILATGTHP